MSRIQITDEMLYKYVLRAEQRLLEQIPPDHELQHIFSNGFEHKMKRLIRRDKCTSLTKAFAVYVRRAAIIFLIILAMAFTTVMSVQALRIRFFEIITEIYKELTSISFILDEKQSDVQLQVREPLYLPEGFTKTETKRSYTTVYIIYANKADTEIIFEQAYITNNQIIVDTENTEIEKLQINGNEVQYIFNKETHQFIWYEGEYAFSLMSSIEKSELVKMVESIEYVGCSKNTQSYSEQFDYKPMVFINDSYYGDTGKYYDALPSDKWSLAGTIQNIVSKTEQVPKKEFNSNVGESGDNVYNSSDDSSIILLEVMVNEKPRFLEFKIQE